MKYFSFIYEKIRKRIQGNKRRNDTDSLKTENSSNERVSQVENSMAENISVLLIAIAVLCVSGALIIFTDPFIIIFGAFLTAGSVAISGAIGAIKDKKKLNAIKQKNNQEGSRVDEFKTENKQEFSEHLSKEQNKTNIVQITDIPVDLQNKDEGKAKQYSIGTGTPWRKNQ